MESVKVDLGERSYDILIETGGLYQLGSQMLERGLKGRVVIITNPDVNTLYGDVARRSLMEVGLEVETLMLPEGEENKQLRVIAKAYDYLIEHNHTRQSIIVALGGGVIGDMAGFIAATFLRGVPFVQVPTTLLAMVDSSVGGKTGVNHHLAKNMIGAFYQPKMVLIDLDTLHSLTREEFRAGYAEVIKYGVIWDSDLFESLEKSIDRIFGLDPVTLGEMIKRSCEIKAEVVRQDEYENGIRAILNYGHTFGHSLEAITLYKEYRHGEAVAIGMVAAARTAEAMGMIDAETTRRIEKHIAAAGLPILFPAVDAQEVLARFKKDKKALGGTVRFILPERLGKVVARDDVCPKLTREIIEGMQL